MIPKMCNRRCRHIFSLALLALLLHPSPAPAAEESAAALAARIVSLTEPHEREVRAIRFMLAVAPLPLPAGLGDCMTARVLPHLKEYLAGVYAGQLTVPELRQAVTFFEGETGRQVVAIRHRHEAESLAAAARGERVGPEEPVYPPAVRLALEAFGETPAGKFFTPDDLVSRPQVTARISELRSEAMGHCLSPPSPSSPEK